jgi:expansin (peptidoglycan-binding protein)
MRSRSVRPAVRAATISVVLVLAACGGGGGGGGDPVCYDAAPYTGSAASFGARLATASCFPEEHAMPAELGQAAVRPDSIPGGLASCGACLELAGPAGTRVALVVEDCELCGPTVDLDLDAATFAGVTGVEEGLVEIEARAVPCPVAGNLRWASSTATNPYFVQLYALDHRHPLDAIALRVGDAFVPLERSDVNAWRWTSSAGATVEPPYTLRVTDVFGHVVEDTVDVAADAVATGVTQLPACR